jgi:hypothetical protein
VGKKQNAKFYLGEIACCGMDWIDLFQDRDQWNTPVYIVITFLLA